MGAGLRAGVGQPLMASRVTGYSSNHATATVLTELHTSLSHPAHYHMTHDDLFNTQLCQLLEKLISSLPRIYHVLASIT
ncbi:hypothetical protein E2C01_016910 [Portunus trituberculatus]|uniref:Uncharacterized protein n=1 Tax=Portunus trituberculatus TaxID=210409 RepID=A0A5B7DS61_PORTR|nr:hypothetical protein [Portunus trituberculatus]